MYLHPNDELPIFERAKLAVQKLRQAAQRGEWQRISPLQQSHARGNSMQSPEAKFGSKLTVPFESAYNPGQMGDAHDNILAIIDAAIVRYDPGSQTNITGKFQFTYGEAGLPGNRAGGFTLYTNHPDVYPFRALEEEIDRLRGEIAKDWEIKDGKLIREFPVLDPAFLAVQPMLHSLPWKVQRPSVEFYKDGKPLPPPADEESHFDKSKLLYPVLAACGIRKVSDFPWDNKEDCAKCMLSFLSMPPDLMDKMTKMTLTAAAQNGISARITIHHPDDIKFFGKEAGRDFLGKGRGGS